MKGQTVADVQRENASWMRMIVTSFAFLAVLATAAVPSYAKAAPATFADLAEKVTPAVVNISSTQTIERRRGPNFRIPEGTPFGEFFDEFRDRLQRDQDEEPRQATSLGSGFIIAADGFVVTNNHVIENSDEITVILEDGTEYIATLVGGDKRSDLALLKIEADEPLPFVAWGDSEKDRIGDWVMAVGNPYGLGNTVTAGIISGRNRAVGGTGPDVDYIQTDAPINRGNSGGPLFNMAGNVIGVNSAILSPSGGNIGIGFSIPSTYASYAISQLKEHGRIRRGWLGVFISPFDEEAAKSLGIKEITSGVLVNELQEGSPAEKAGLEVGDIIYKWDGKDVEDQRSLQQVVALTPVGKTVKVQILRDGEKKIVDVVTGELPNDEADDAVGEDGQKAPGREESQLIQGMEMSELTDELRQRFDYEDGAQGVVVTNIERNSAASRLGIRAGALIQRVNQRPVSTPEDVAAAFEDALSAGRSSALVLLTQRGISNHVVLELKSESDKDE